MQHMCKCCKCKHQSYADLSVYLDCFEFAEFKPWVPSTGDADGRIVVRVGGLVFTHFQLEAPQNWISDVGTFNASQNLQYLKSLKSFISGDSWTRRRFQSIWFDSKIKAVQCCSTRFSLFVKDGICLYFCWCFFCCFIVQSGAVFLAICCIWDLESLICMPVWLLAFWLWPHLAFGFWLLLALVSIVFWLLAVGFIWLLAVVGFWFWLHMAFVPRRTSVESMQCVVL